MKPKRCPALSMLLLITFPQTNSEHGTAAILIWKPDKVVVGTDSMVAHFSSAHPTLACKIRHYGRFWFVASGLYRYDPTGYNMWSLAHDALAEAKSVPDAANAIADKVSTPLEIALGNIRLGHPIDYKNTFSESFAAFMVIGVEDGKVVAAGRNFVPQGILKVEYPGPREVTPSSIGYLNFGEGGAMERVYPYGSQALVMLLNKDPGDAIRTLIQIEIDSTPKKVGPPISILEVTPTGHHWIERGHCQEDPGSTRP
jgi:hypothetical protein